MCGGKLAHPLLISLTNISMTVWNKAASHGFLLLALMPIPKFLHEMPRMHSLLEAHLFHQCLNIVLEPLKQAAQFGCTIPDPLGINITVSYHSFLTLLTHLKLAWSLVYEY